MHETRCHKNLREIVSFILCLMFLLPPIYEHFDNHKYLKLGGQITLINSVKRKKSWFSFLKLFLYRRFLLKKIVIVYIPLSNICASFVHIYIGMYLVIFTSINYFLLFFSSKALLNLTGLKSTRFSSNQFFDLSKLSAT